MSNGCTAGRQHQLHSICDATVIIRNMRIPLGCLLVMVVGVLLSGGCAQPNAAPVGSETLRGSEALAVSPTQATGQATTHSPTSILEPTSPPENSVSPTATHVSITRPNSTLAPTLAPTAIPRPNPTIIRSTLPDTVLELLIDDLAALQKSSPAEFRFMGNNLVNDFIALHAGEGQAADAQFIKACIGDVGGRVSVDRGQSAEPDQSEAPSDSAGPGTTETLKDDDDPQVRSLSQFPDVLRGHYMHRALLEHPKFSSVMTTACPLFFNLINGPFERYLLWRSWEPDKVSFAATEIAEEILRTSYGDIVDYTLAMTLHDDEAEKLRLLERVIDNSPERRIARTAFKQLFKAYQQQPERARDLAERWLQALIDAQAPDRELLEVLHRLESVAPDPIYHSVLQSRILQVTNQDYLGELETDKDYLGTAGFRFAPSWRIIPDGAVLAGVDQNSMSQRGFEFVSEALHEWQMALRNRVTFLVTFLPLPPRPEGNSVCVDDSELSAMTWTVYSYDLGTYEAFSGHDLDSQTGEAPTLGSLPAGLAVMPLFGPCRSVGVREDVLAGDPVWLKYVFLHETGHLLSLPHSPHPDDVMNQSHTINNTLTERDIRTISKLYFEHR